MVKKQPKGPAAKNDPTGKNIQHKSEDKTAAKPEQAAVDRPGFDLGGSTGKTRAGTGLGLGKDSFETRDERSLPGRRDKGDK